MRGDDAAHNVLTSAVSRSNHDAARTNNRLLYEAKQQHAKAAAQTTN